MSQEPIIVGIYGDPMAAHLARTRLESEGIEAFVIDENLVTWDPLLANAIGGVKVVVSPADAQAARVVLGRKTTEQQRTCPECRSTRVSVSQAGKRAAILTILFLGFPIGRARSTCRCEDCQHSWRE